MVAQLCPSSCLILCTSTILELLPPQHLVDADMECPSSCVHACVEASRVHERSGGSFGQSLKDKWREGPKAYLGLATEGFPNLFMITGPGSPSVLSNVIVSIEQHVDWLTRLLSHMRETGQDRVEATREAEENWADRVRNIAEKTLLPKAATWYMGANIPGKPRVFMPFMGVHSYRRICNEIAADGYRGFVLDRAGDAGQQAARSA